MGAGQQSELKDAGIKAPDILEQQLSWSETRSRPLPALATSAQSQPVNSSPQPNF